MANILNFRAICHRFGNSRKQKQQLLEAETLNFRVLMDCSNQQNLKKLKEAISLSVHKRNILVIIDKIISLTRNFSKVLVILAWFLLLFFVIIFINSIYQSCIPSWSFSKWAFSHLYCINIWKFVISMVNI